MNRSWLIMGCVGLVLVAIGCLPEERVVWSPDGQRALVRAADGLYACDESGKLSERIVARTGPVAWYPDSRHLLCVEGVEAATWDELAAEWTVPDEKTWNARADELRARILAYEGDWGDFDFRLSGDISAPKVIALLMYVRDERNEGLPEKLGDKWGDMEKLSLTMHALSTYAMLGDTASLKTSFVVGVDGIRSVRLSPDGRYVAYVVDEGAKLGTSLLVAPVDGSSAPRLVQKQVGAYPDWTADGHHLAFARASLPHPLMDEDAVGLGAIAVRRVLSDGGELLEKFPDTEDLAGVLFYDTMRVRCLRDGRMLFVAQDVQLPCAAGDMPQHFTLFEMIPGVRPTVARAITYQADEAIGDTMGFFEVSPDESRVVIQADDGKVMLYNLGSGKVTTVLDQKGGKCKTCTLPVWRSNRELCFAAPRADDEERYDIVLWSNERVRAISQRWPDSVVRDFLLNPTPKPDATQAAEATLAPAPAPSE